MATKKTCGTKTVEFMEKVPFPYIVDLVEENVRNRFVFPLVALALYIVLAVTIAPGLIEPANPVTEVRVVFPPGGGYEVNQSFSSLGPIPRVKISGKNGPAAANVTLKLTDLVIEGAVGVPNCDRLTRAGMAGSLEYIRLEDVCKVENSVVNISASNAKTGYASIEAIFARAPKGLYGFGFNANNITSELRYSYLSSNVGYLVTQEPYAPITQQIGVPFANQPSIMVYDQAGNPLPGKKVIAFTWNEPTFLSEPTTNQIQAYKQGYLTGAVSTISDEKGIATFKNLTVVGTNSESIYIFFSCDDAAVTPWRAPQNYFAEAFSAKMFFPPIKLTTNVATITIITLESSTAVEGVKFAVQPALRVVDSGGIPVANKLVWAMLVKANSDTLPNMFQRKTDDMNTKFLIRPISATYSSNLMDPLTPETYFQPLLTDSSGLVTFRDLAFSVTGPAGLYKIAYFCDGKKVISTQDIRVSTSVDSIKVLRQPIFRIAVDEVNVPEVFNLLFKAADAKGDGVAGKLPKITFVDLMGVPIASQVLSVYVLSSSDYLSPTDDLGISELTFNVHGAASDVTFLRIGITIDSITTYTQEFRIEYTQKSTFCGGVQDSDIPVSVQTGNSFTATYTVTDESGAPLQYSPFLVRLTYPTFGFTSFPKESLPLINWAGFTDVNGQITAAIQIPSGSYGHYYVQGFAVSGLSSIIQDQIYNDIYIHNTGETDIYNKLMELIESTLSTEPGSTYFMDDSNWKFCYASWTRVLIVTRVETIEVTPVYPQDFSTSATMGTAQTFTVKFLDQDYSPYASKDIDLTLVVLQKPGYLYTVSQTEFVTFSPTTTATTNAAGVVTATITINPGYPGAYAFSILADGSFSDPITFTTNFPTGGSITFQANVAVTDNSGNGPQRVGNYLGPASTGVKVVLKDSSNNPLSDYYIIAAVDTTSLDSEYIKAHQDFLDLERDPFLSMTSSRISKTDASGVADFKSLTITDLRDSACVRFIFYMGESGRHIASPPSNLVCFENDVSIKFASLSYSTLIAQNAAFGAPVTIRVSRTQGISDSETKGHVSFVALPVAVNSKQIGNPMTSAKYYLSNFICIYYNKILLPTMKGTCSPSLNIVQSGSSVYYDVTFKKLKWIQASNGVNFKLSLTTPLNYPILVDASTPASLSSKFDKFVGLQPILAKYSPQVLQNMPLSELQSLNLGQYIPSFQSINYNNFDASSIPDLLQSFTNLFSSSQTRPSSIETSSITVTSSPAYLDIQLQPPTTAFIGDSFQVAVKAVISSGAPVSETFVQAGILPISDFVQNLTPEKLGDYINLLGQGKIGAKELSVFTSDQNIIIDKLTDSTKTNQKGIAFFSIRTLSGRTGNYTVSFQSKEARDRQSVPFQLINRIKNVSFVNDISSSVKVTFGKPAALPIQPVIQLTYLNIQTSIEKRIEIKVYEYIPGLAFNATEIEHNNSNIDSVYDNYRRGVKNLGLTPFITLSNVISAVTNAGKIDKSNLNQDEGFVYNLTQPEETADARFYFSNIKINFVKEGKFRIVISVDGIETIPDNIIQVIKAPANIVEQIATDLEKFIIILVSIFMLLGNSPYHHILWMILAVISIALGYGLFIAASGDTNTFDILVYVVFGLMALSLVEIIYQYCKRKYKKPFNMIYHARAHVAYEYTYQKFNKAASAFWKKQVEDYTTKKKKTDVFELSFLDENQESPDFLSEDRLKTVSKNLIEDGKRGVKPKEIFVSSLTEIQQILDNVFEGAPEQKKEPKKELEVAKSKQELAPELLGEKQESKVLDQNKELKKPEVQKDAQDDTSAIKRIKILLQPFYTKYKADEVKDFFFFPQKLFAGLVLGTVSVVVIANTAFTKIAGVKDNIGNMKVKIYESFMKIIQSALAGMSSFGGFSFTEYLFEQQQESIEFVYHHLDKFANAITIGFTISATIACLLYILSVLTLFGDFKYRILLLRSGKPDFDPAKIMIKDTSAYIGSQVANSALGWIIVTLIFGIIFTILSLPLFWLVVKYYLPTIIAVILAPGLIQTIVVLIVQRLAIGPNSILRRRLWGLLEIFLFFITIATGIVTALMRLIKMLVVSLVGIMRMDQPLVPDWFLKINNTDAAFKSYLATILIYHTYNHPIYLTFARILIHHSQIKKLPGIELSNEGSNKKLKVDLLGKSEEKLPITNFTKEDQIQLPGVIERPKLTKKIIANKLRLWLVMVKYHRSKIQLSKLRKAYLAAQAELKKKEEELKKKNNKPEDKGKENEDKNNEQPEKKKRCIIF